MQKDPSVESESGKRIYSLPVQKTSEDLNVFKVEELLGSLDTKKKISERIQNRLYTIKKDRMESVKNKEEAGTLRDCILSASTSSYLRSVILVAESDTHYFLSVYEPEEETLTKEELAGALINHESSNILRLKEYQNKYEVKMNQIRKHLETDINLFHLKNLTLANIHHDYVRYFGEGDSLKEVMLFHILHNGTEALTKVIRKV